MKLAAVLACAAVASAEYQDAMSALKIQVKPWGQKKIEKEAKDVMYVAEKIKNAPATNDSVAACGVGCVGQLGVPGGGCSCARSDLASHA